MHVEQLHTLAGAAREVGLARQTVQRAVSIGRIPCYQTKDGLRLVKLSDVESYRRNPLPPGRPPKVGRGKRRKR